MRDSPSWGNYLMIMIIVVIVSVSVVNLNTESCGILSSARTAERQHRSIPNTMYIRMRIIPQNKIGRKITTKI